MNCLALLARSENAFARGLPLRALELCTCALNGSPEPELEWQIRMVRAEAYLETDDHARVARDCQRAAQIRDSVRLRVTWARSCAAQDKHPEAVLQYELAIAVGELTAWQWHDYARSLLVLKSGVEAQRAAEHATELDSKEIEHFLLLVRASIVTGQAPVFLPLLLQRCQSEPYDARVWAVLGGVEAAMGHHSEAIAAYRRCLALAPTRSDVAHSLSLLLMRQGNFEEGWTYHEHRLPDIGRSRRAGVPSWQGEPLDGKHLVVWCEQGFGDTIQFARFVPLLTRSVKVTFLVTSPLVCILREHGEMGDVRSTEQGLVSADYQAKVMSLPRYLGIGANVAVAPCPFLRPNRLLCDEWSRVLPAGVKVALAWQGNPNYCADSERSMPLYHYEPLIASAGKDVSFISLQKNFGREQLESSSLERRILDLGDSINLNGDAFRDSLAILSLVDLFVTTDTALAHLAGAAGVPTWLLLSAAPDWRWGTSGETTCWYPSMRLCRQSELGNWEALLARLSLELPERLSRTR
ncbi:MAG: tetratricopeptide repeat protein [Polyangiaceae bacterium]